MVLRAVRLIAQAALVLQVLHGSVPVNGVKVENFQTTDLTSDDKLGAVGPAQIPDSNDKMFAEHEERGFFDIFSNGSPPKGDSANLATTTPIPGSPERPSASSLMSQYGSMFGEFKKKANDNSDGDESTAEAGSDATTTEDATKAPKSKKAKKPVATSESATGSSEASASGSEEAMTKKPSTKKLKKPVLIAESASESEEASGSEEVATKKPSTKKHKKPILIADSASESEEASGSEEAATKKPSTKKHKKPVLAAESESASGSDDSSDLISGLTTSGSDDFSDLLGSDFTGSGSEDDMTDLLDSSGDSGSGDSFMDMVGSGSMLGYEDFVKKFSGMFGSGSGVLDMFRIDPTKPQNKTVDDDDILIGELYGGKEHGHAFSDIKNIRFGQRILNITVRGQERVDSVGMMVMTQEFLVNLVHGGKGGTEGYIEPEMGDTITSVEVHWDKNKGKTCIFYIKLTTSGGKAIATGTETANSAVINPPKGYQIAGFHGRDSGAGIFCIGAIFTKTTAMDLAVTDVMALTGKGSPDVYNYKTTIRNWVGPLEKATDSACYQKKFDVNSQGVCPSGFNKNDNSCVTQCPINYPVDCLSQCIPQNADCTYEIVSKVASVVGVALNVATMGVFGAFIAGFKTANFVLTCAINVINSVKSIVYYLRYAQTVVPLTDTQRLLDKAFQLQIVILDLPMTICGCLGIKIPRNLQFSHFVLTVVSGLAMMAVMVGEMLFASSNNVLMMLRESGALNKTALDKSTIDLDTFLNTKNGTCGFEMKTLTNRVMGKVQEIRSKTPDADKSDVRVAVSQSPIITEDIPIVTNHCMGQIWTNKTGASSYATRHIIRKTLGVIVDQLIEDGTTDMGKNVIKKENALEYANLGLFFLSVLDPTGIAWMASEFVQPICGPTEYVGEIDDGTLYDALALTTVDDAFLGSYGVWKKKGDGSVTIFFESVDNYDVSVVIKSGGDKLKEVRVPANGKATWTSTVKELQDKTLYLDRWRPGLFGLPGSGGGSLLMWIPRSSEGGYLTLHARLNVS